MGFYFYNEAGCKLSPINNRFWISIPPQRFDHEKPNQLIGIMSKKMMYLVSKICGFLIVTFNYNNKKFKFFQKVNAPIFHSVCNKNFPLLFVVNFEKKKYKKLFKSCLRMR